LQGTLRQLCPLCSRSLLRLGYEGRHLQTLFYWVTFLDLISFIHSTQTCVVIKFGVIIKCSLTLRRLLQSVGGNGAVCNCRRCSQTKQLTANWGQSLHLQCSVTLPGHNSFSLVSQPYKWYHLSSQNNQPQVIKYRYTM